LITGITGFAGSYLAKDLIKKGARVWGLMRFRADRVFPKNLADKGLQEGFQLVEGDITDLYSLLSVLDAVKPQVIFHLAAQSFVHRSFSFSLETVQINSVGTANLLEAARMRSPDATIVFAGSSEEYGMVFVSEEQFNRVSKTRKYFPEPTRFPEVPITETNPLRPLSPYAATKVYGDFMMRQYHISYGMKTVVSRAFNHEGAGRGGHFVTSIVAKQIAQLIENKRDNITIGNVSAFRDWSHVSDIVSGYQILAEKGEAGQVYNQGSKRANSVLSLILMGLEQAGYHVLLLRTMKNGKRVEEPGKMMQIDFAGCRFPGTKMDEMMLKGEMDFVLDDQGLVLETDKGIVEVLFDPQRFRPSDVPILLADHDKISKLGFRSTKSLSEIIRDQINYYLSPENLEAFLE